MLEQAEDFISSLEDPPSVMWVTLLGRGIGIKMSKGLSVLHFRYHTFIIAIINVNMFNC